MRKPQGKKANQNERGRVKQAEERRKKRQRSEEPGVCPPSRPPSPFPDLCYVIDAALEAVEGAGLEPADVPPGEPRTCGSMLMYAFPERCLCIYLPAVCTHPLPSQRLSRRQCTLTAH
jgi:hypothetical protein